MSKKQLERDEEKAVISGVLAGMANYFEQDPLLFRVAAIAFLVLTGFFPGIILYIAAWIMMPKRMHKPLDVEYEVVD
jgi:phage shock protein PspC (stress-responsive transcriptional regulator)